MCNRISPERSSEWKDYRKKQCLHFLQRKRCQLWLRMQFTTSSFYETQSIRVKSCSAFLGMKGLLFWSVYLATLNRLHCYSIHTALMFCQRQPSRGRPCLTTVRGLNWLQSPGLYKSHCFSHMFAAFFFFFFLKWDNRELRDCVRLVDRTIHRYKGYSFCCRHAGEWCLLKSHFPLQINGLCIKWLVMGGI